MGAPKAWDLPGRAAMKPILSAIAILTLGMILVTEVDAGPRRVIVAPRGRAGVTFFSSGAAVQRQFYGAYPYYYPTYAVPVVVASPFGQSYFLPPTVVVSEPFFCVLHNQGFVTRIGLVDHLAGAHKFPLDAASDLCPEARGSCLFPSY